MRGGFLTFILLFGLLGGSWPLIAKVLQTHSEEALPPLGKRRYLLGDQRSAARPVAIKGLSGNGQGPFLLDPRQPGVLPPEQPPRPRPKKVVVQPAAKAGELRFRRLQVLGHLRQPRVDFTRDELPLERADEPVSQDFYPKVFAPAQDDDF